MGDEMTVADKVSDIEAVLVAGLGFCKTKTNGCVLGCGFRTQVDGLDKRICNLLKVVRSGCGLERNDARDLVWIVDFLAVAMPDNSFIPWNPSSLKLASGLRQRYAATFGVKAYLG